MSESNNVSRIVGTLVLLMAALVMLSGPVAQVLDLPEPTAQAKKKKKKKKKKNRPPAFNVVQCPTESDNHCNGSAFNDFLVGRTSFDSIFGGEGNDVYQSNDGGDNLFDESATSSDFYTALDPESNSGFAVTNDEGGSADFLDMGTFRLGEDFSFIRNDVPPPSIDGLTLDGPGSNDVFITNHFGPGRIETIRFANATVTGSQAEDLAREATPEEQAELEESLPEEVRSSQDKVSPEKE